jgi:hypothetical protein
MVAGLIGAAARTCMRNEWRPSQMKQENERRREEMSLRKQQRQPRPRSASPSASSRLHSPTCAVPLAQSRLRRGIPALCLSIRLFPLAQPRLHSPTCTVPLAQRHPPPLHPPLPSRLPPSSRRCRVCCAVTHGQAGADFACGRTSAPRDGRRCRGAPLEATQRAQAY